MNEQSPKTFREIVGEAIGEASMCWSKTPSGIFESTRASAIVNKIFDAFHLEAGMNVTRWVEIKIENAALHTKLAVAVEALEAVISGESLAAHEAIEKIKQKQAGLVK